MDPLGTVRAGKGTRRAMVAVGLIGVLLFAGVAAASGVIEDGGGQTAPVWAVLLFAGFALLSAWLAAAGVAMGRNLRVVLDHRGIEAHGIWGKRRRIPSAQILHVHGLMRPDVTMGTILGGVAGGAIGAMVGSAFSEEKQRVARLIVHLRGSERPIRIDVSGLAQADLQTVLARWKTDGAPLTVGPGKAYRRLRKNGFRAL